jgi:DNA-binding transcriptional LysR family regulator
MWDEGCMRIELIREFIVLTKHKNYSAAARELFCSQPGLSNHMSNLEKELGFKLIDRQGNHFSLTAAGSEFLRYAQSIVSTYDKAQEQCKSIAKDMPRIRMQSVAPYSNLFKLLQRFDRIPFTFIELGSEFSVFKAFEKQLIDVGFHFDYSQFPSIVAEAEALGLASIPVCTESLAVSFAKSHPLAKKARICREDVRDCTVRIYSGQHFDYWKQFVPSMFGEDLGLSFVLDPLECLSNLSFVDFDDAIYICGQGGIHELLSHRDDVVIHDTIEGVELRVPMVLVYRADFEQHNIRALVEEIKQMTP